MVVDPATIFNITMKFFNLPAPPNTPAVGMRVDFWDPTTRSFPANSSIFFYQTGTKVTLCCRSLHERARGPSESRIGCQVGRDV